MGFAEESFPNLIFWRELDQHLLAFNFHFVCSSALGCWHGQRGTVGNIKARPVPRTSDLTTVQVAVAERSAVMGANVVNAVEFPFDVKDDHQLVLHFENFFAGIADFARLADCLKFRHRCLPILLAETRAV